MDTPRFAVGDEVFFYGTGFGNHFDYCIISGRDDQGFYIICPNVVANYPLRVHEKDLYPKRPLDSDIHKLTWEKLQDEVMRWRQGARSLLAQSGDDLCWADWYTLFGRLLPHHEHCLQLNTCLPKEIQLHNCEKFVDACLAGKPNNYHPDSPEAIIKHLQDKIDGMEAIIRSHEEDRYSHAPADQ